MTFILLMFFAYAVGGIPFGLLLGRLFADVDVRDFGSKNIGATNVNRVLGRKLGAATLLCDISKGLFCVILAHFLLADRMEVAWVGFAAFIGHCYPMYLQFKGGKGVATAVGVIAFMAPVAAIVGLLVWILVVKISKISAMGALVASVTIPVTTYFTLRSPSITFIFTLMMLIVILRHKENIQRMYKGTENAP